jgi:hypothetical protein
VGEFLGQPGVSDSYYHAGLTNDTHYYYTAFAFDASRNFAAGVHDSATPHDDVPPGQISGVSATPGDNSVTLRWTNPADADFDHTLIRYSTDGFPPGPDDGDPVDEDGKFPNAPASTDSFAHTGLVNGMTYYYALFTADEVPNYAVPQTVSGLPDDTDPPPGVVSFDAAVRGDGSVRLRWENPDHSDLVGVLIRYSVDHEPSSPTDGVAVENGSDGRFDALPAEVDSFIHTGLVSDTTHYYSLWAYDEVPNYSDRTIVHARPEDETPPELALSVFQNPYLTNYLDIYLMSPEALVDTSVHCTFDGTVVGMGLADPGENVWMGNYELTETGTDTVYAMARDISLNWNEISHVFSSTLILEAAGGTAWSPDGKIGVEVPPDACGHDFYMLICEDRNKVPGLATAYRISPAGLDLRGFVEISLVYSEDMGPPEHLAVARIEGGVSGPVMSYLDSENKRLLAFVDKLGTYGLIWNPDAETPEYGAGELVVLQNVPNPFAGTTRIGFDLPRAGRVQAEVITIDGRIVAGLCDRFVIPGRHDIEWDGRDGDGQAAASGVYFYRVRFGSETVTKKMVNLR